MTGYYPQISDEDEYEVRNQQLVALLSILEEYEDLVYPIGEPTRWGNICFHWHRAWRWEIQWALYGALLGMLITLAWLAGQ